MTKERFLYRSTVGLHRLRLRLKTKVHRKALVRYFAMYGCESWTVNKADEQRNSAFVCLK